MNFSGMKFYNYIIFFTLLALVINEIFSKESQYVIALLGIFSLGILHGSNDLFVIQKVNKNPQQGVFLRSLLTYIGVVFLFVVVFFFLPSLALLAFILISGYHFGEQHFHHKIDESPNSKVSLFYLFYGLLVLFDLLFLNTEEVLFIIRDMTGFLFPDEFLLYALLVSFMGSCIFFVLIAKNNPKLQESLLINVFYLILFSTLFYISDVVWSFATYFVLWHSLPSLKDQVNSLYGKFSWTNVFKYFKKAFPYWIVSLIGMSVVVYLFKDSNYFLSLLFAFIASITFPHVFVMRTLFKTRI